MNTFELIKKEFENNVKIEVPAILKPCAVSIKKVNVYKALKIFVKGLVYGVAALIYAFEIFCLVIVYACTLAGILVKALGELKEIAIDVLVDVIVKAIEVYEKASKTVKEKVPVILAKAKETYLNVSLKATELVILSSLTVKLFLSKAKSKSAKALESAYNFRKELIDEQNAE